MFEQKVDELKVLPVAGNGQEGVSAATTHVDGQVPSSVPFGIVESFVLVPNSSTGQFASGIKPARLVGVWIYAFVSILLEMVLDETHSFGFGRPQKRCLQSKHVQHVERRE